MDARPSPSTTWEHSPELDGTASPRGRTDPVTAPVDAVYFASDDADISKLVPRTAMLLR